MAIAPLLLASALAWGIAPAVLAGVALTPLADHPIQTPASAWGWRW